MSIYGWKPTAMFPHMNEFQMAMFARHLQRLLPVGRHALRTNLYVMSSFETKYGLIDVWIN